MPHAGGKRLAPHLGQVPEVLLNVTRCPPFPGSVRWCWPRACRGTAQVGHHAAGCPDVFPHSRLSLAWAASWRICASRSIIGLWTSSSISTSVALGCARRHSFTFARISRLFSRHACSSIFGPFLSVVFQIALSYHFPFTWTIPGAKILGAPSTGSQSFPPMSGYPRHEIFFGSSLNSFML